MKWYNVCGILLIIADVIGGILGYNGYIFKGMSLGVGVIIFGIVLMIGLILTFINFGDIEFELQEED